MTCIVEVKQGHVRTSVITPNKKNEGFKVMHCKHNVQKERVSCNYVSEKWHGSHVDYFVTVMESSTTIVLCLL